MPRALAAESPAWVAACPSRGCRLNRVSLVLPGDEMRDLEIVPDSLLHPSSDRPTFIDRLANSLTKRKRSTPQKFVGKGIFPRRASRADRREEEEEEGEGEPLVPGWAPPTPGAEALHLGTRLVFARRLSSPRCWDGAGPAGGAGEGEDIGVWGVWGWGCTPNPTLPVLTPLSFPAGEKQMRFTLSDLPFDVNSGFEKDVEMVSAHHPLDPSYGSSLSLMGGEHLRPLRLPPTNCISEVTPVISSVYTQIQPLPGRLEMPGSREAAEGHEDVGDGVQVVYRGREQGASPTNGCQDSTDTESNHEERSSQLPAGNCASSRQSPAYAKEDPKLPEGPPAARSTPSSAKEALRVVNEDGEQIRAFKCEHCRILFLDHVMFTIHMGCHGFRDPFECNICGYHSQDRYEFSSHIVRGEHKVG